jgi:beta-aspartyl-dipeptidase (metallo-type)
MNNTVSSGTLILLSGGEVYAPEFLGKRDVLICGGKVVSVEADLGRFAALDDVEVIDISGKHLVPGFIDNHVHLLGGGGGGGPATQGPEIHLSEFTSCGTTTVVGILGTDGLTRHLSSLLSKARALTEEGITAYIWSGAYQYPPPNLCGGAQWDLLLIPEVVGTGEIAIADERGTQPTVDELTRLASETALGARLAGKRGPVCIHVGEGREKLAPLRSVLEGAEIKMDRFLPTHLNRNPELLQDAFEYGLQGGLLDFTASFSMPGGLSSSIPASQAADDARKAGVPLERILFSTDGNGVFPFFDEDGKTVGMARWPISSLWEEARKLAREFDWPLEDALAPVTGNPAKVLGISKGGISTGHDADLVVLDEKLNIVYVYAKGRCLVENGNTIARGACEQLL